MGSFWFRDWIGLCSDGTIQSPVPALWIVMSPDLTPDVSLTDCTVDAEAYMVDHGCGGCGERMGG